MQKRSPVTAFELDPCQW